MLASEPFGVDESAHTIQSLDCVGAREFCDLLLGAVDDGLGAVVR